MKTLYLVIILLTLCLIAEYPSHVEATICTPMAYQQERQPANTFLIKDLSGNQIVETVQTGKQIQISIGIVNQRNCDQPFAYLMQIQNVNGDTVSFSWITGTLYANESLNPSLIWTPLVSGQYTARNYIWQGIDNPNAVLPPASTVINVG